MDECFLLLPMLPNQNERKLSFNIKDLILDFLKIEYSTDTTHLSQCQVFITAARLSR